MRLELFFKTAGELQGLLALVRAHGIGAVNLVNKAKADPLLAQIHTIKAALPHVDVVPHFSLKYQYRNGSADLTFEAARKFCAAAAEEGVREVLLVSGSGPKKQLDAVRCLELFAEERQASSSSNNNKTPLDQLTFGVAYNPYLPDTDGLLAEEQRRLQAKLATGIVSSVWLQIGADPARLRRGLEFLLQEKHNNKQPPVRIVGSLVIPSRKFLAMMKFRPWAGVHLSDEYLSSVEAADAVTRRILDVYRDFGVEPIVETAVKNDADLARVKELAGEDLFFRTPTAMDGGDGVVDGKGSGGGAGGGGGGGRETRASKKARIA